MKNLPLSMQIWLIFGVTLAVSLILVTSLPLLLQGFFTPEIYLTLESAQDSLLAQDQTPDPKGRPPRRGDPRSHFRQVNHIFLGGDGELPSVPSQLPSDLLETMEHQALTQGESIRRYKGSTETGTVYYVIRKLDGNPPRYLVSYMFDIYRDWLLQRLFFRFVATVAVIFLLSWLPSISLARYLARPMVALEKHVKRIAERDWHEPVPVTRRDEIGSLAGSIEKMRARIKQQDEAQQTFLQHLSHELKTPVMTIRSYAQSVKDGIFPKGDLLSSITVIDEEAQRLERRIYSLLYLTKLDYLAVDRPRHFPLDLAELVEDSVDRLRWQRSELNWSLELVPAQVPGDSEQLTVALENIFDNQVRHAAANVSVQLYRTEEGGRPLAVLRVWNDGSQIEQDTMDKLFQPFYKGRKGEFGLGLAIVRRIAENHNAEVFAENAADGVAFYLKLPLA